MEYEAEIEYEATGGRRNIAHSEFPLVSSGYELRDRAARGERDSLRDRDRVTARSSDYVTLLIFLCNCTIYSCI